MLSRCEILTPSKRIFCELAPSELLFRNPLHPYTRSLLRAVPSPNPDIERDKRHMAYSPTIHDYSGEPPSWIEVEGGHFVHGSRKEIEAWMVGKYA